MGETHDDLIARLRELLDPSGGVTAEVADYHTVATTGGLIREVRAEITRLKLALGEAEKRAADFDDARDIIDDLVQCDGEQWAIGGGPGWKERQATAMGRAQDFVRIEP